MRVYTLIENTEGTDLCRTEHGLSLYFETEHHKILMDTGASETFLRNARLLGVKLEEVDICVLSHGHYDHAGGLMGFVCVNPKVPIYMSHLAGKEYYHNSATEQRYIGIDKHILRLPQIHYLSEDEKIDEELSIFSNVTGRRLWPQGNKVLFEKKDEGFVQDEFLHEQYLVIKEQGKQVLVSGCAHNGVLNILDRYHEIYGNYPDIVISGFHMKKKTPYTDQEIQVIKETAEELKDLPTVFYTGHCTGEEPYAIMKEIMGDKIHYIHCGDILEL